MTDSPETGGENPGSRLTWKKFFKGAALVVVLLVAEVVIACLCGAQG